MGEARQRSCVLRAVFFHLLQHPCELHALSGTARHSFALSALLTSTSPVLNTVRHPQSFQSSNCTSCCSHPVLASWGSRFLLPTLLPSTTTPSGSCIPGVVASPGLIPGAAVSLCSGLPPGSSLSGSTTHRFNLSQNIFLTTARKKHLFTLQEY